jgi:hypothetical protein
MPVRINNGTATMMKLFMELYMDWMIRLTGMSVKTTSEATDAIPRPTASGTPAAIKPMKIASRVKLIF